MSPGGAVLNGFCDRFWSCLACIASATPRCFPAVAASVRLPLRRLGTSPQDHPLVAPAPPPARATRCPAEVRHSDSLERDTRDLLRISRDGAIRSAASNCAQGKAWQAVEKSIRLPPIDSVDLVEGSTVDLFGARKGSTTIRNEDFIHRISPFQQPARACRNRTSQGPPAPPARSRRRRTSVPPPNCRSQRSGRSDKAVAHPSAP